VPEARRLGIGEGFRGLVLGQAVEGQAARREGDGDPAFTLVGAAEVEAPQRARRAKFGGQTQGEEFLMGLQVPEADGHVGAHGGRAGGRPGIRLRRLRAAHWRLHRLCPCCPTQDAHLARQKVAGVAAGLGECPGIQSRGPAYYLPGLGVVRHPGQQRLVGGAGVE
jgi:hypothetical protein